MQVNEIRVQGRMVIVLPDDGEKKTKSGIILPEVGKVKERNNIGKVVAVGPGVKYVCVGDRVHYARKKGSKIILDNIEHLFVHEHQITQKL